MIALRLPAFRANRMLAGAALGLAVIALWPWIVAPTPSLHPRAAPPPAAPAAAPAPLPPLASYKAVVERPLFSPSRRAPPGAAATALAPSIESRYRLVGVMGTGAKHRAFVADGPRRLQIVEGDLLDGWTVRQIAQDRVILSSPAGDDAALRMTRPPAEPPKPQ